MRLDKWSGLNIKYFSNNNIKSSIYRYMQNEHSFIKHVSADHTTTFTRSQTYGHSLTSLPLHAYTHTHAHMKLIKIDISQERFIVQRFFFSFIL